MGRVRPDAARPSRCRARNGFQPSVEAGSRQGESDGLVLMDAIWMWSVRFWHAEGRPRARAGR
jgi:hypothetical protein